MLSKIPNFPKTKAPVLLIVMDGVGIARDPAGSAVAAAKTPTLDYLFQHYPNIRLKAHGKAVGMPSDDDMGNSEVGHNAIGSGQIYAQGAALVSTAIESGAIWQGKAWREIIQGVKDKNKNALHCIGLLSDGNVHSHIAHLKALIIQAKKEHLKKVFIHVLLDGRDVAEQSALDYLADLEKLLNELNNNDFCAQIASGGGRQTITMDRYNANWQMVERGYQTHVLGEAPHFESATAAVLKARSENPKIIDQDLPPFVVAQNGKPIGKIVDGDSVVFFNFRGDRAIEISLALTVENFNKFRTPPLNITFAGMLQYDGDLQIPPRFLVNPPAIENTSGQWFSKSGIAQFACSETQKFGHVTYFWNGNRSHKFEKETWLEIPSDGVSFDERPWMKSAEIADAMINALTSRQYDFLRCNFANGDMVGHTGNFRAATMAVEALDLALNRLLKTLEKIGGIALITADHGNADEMFETDKKTGLVLLDKNGNKRAKTSHTLNPVPLILFNPKAPQFSLKNLENAGLSNLAASVATLLGFEKHPSWEDSLIQCISTVN